ncbi:MAG: hypothetical protein K0R16_90 [Nitrososphaeraceae archaeon]|jgi:hypothetical protein|nr:hypothetical protein [Nitrososphaeraceae archaeon]
MDNKRALLLITLLTIISVSAMGTSHLGTYAIAQSQNQTEPQQQQQQQERLYADLTGNGLPLMQVNTDASGRATFNLLGDGKTMSYTINGTNLENISGVVLGSSTGGRVTDLVLIHYAPTQGLIAEGNGTAMGNFTSADFTGPLAGKQMSDFLKMLIDGNIYLIVRTSDNLLGEIGGKITPALQ